MIQYINDGRSPQQIAGRMRLERHPASVSRETIYQFVYSADGRKEGLWKYLPERRVKRYPRHARRRHGRRFPPELSILHHPDMVAKRTVRPLGLTMFDTVWLLNVWCEDRSNFRNLRVDRIEAIQLAGRLFRKERGSALRIISRRLPEWIKAPALSSVLKE